MTKRVFVVALAVMVFYLVACAGKADDNGVSVTFTGDGDTEANEEDMFVDMTVMNANMVYATVFQMLETPERYEGKTIKLKGTFNAGWYDKTSQYYYYVFIQDATACCSQGLEFLWSGEHSYPDDYPEIGQEIEVIGTFETYKEVGDPLEYCRIANAELTVKMEQ